MYPTASASFFRFFCLCFQHPARSHLSELFEAPPQRVRQLWPRGQAAEQEPGLAFAHGRERRRAGSALEAAPPQRDAARRGAEAQPNSQGTGRRFARGAGQESWVVVEGERLEVGVVRQKRGKQGRVAGAQSSARARQARLQEQQKFKRQTQMISCFELLFLNVDA